jgi:hypothetical protein
MIETPPIAEPQAPAGPSGVLRYLAVLATIAVVGMLVLGSLIYSGIQNVQKQEKKIEQLQVDTNDNLCNQSAYQGGISCVGGDGNG